MMQNNKSTANTNLNHYGEKAEYTPRTNAYTSVFAAQKHYRYKKKTYASSQAKAMAVVLTVAFIVSSATAIIVSSFSKNHIVSAQTISAVSADDKKSANGYSPEQAGANAAMDVQPGNSFAKSASQQMNAQGEITEIFTATGKTSSGYDWNYSSDSDCASVSCTYDFNSQTYHFTAQGAHPGIARVELKYAETDNYWITQAVTIHVDNDLNVTVNE